MSQEVKNGLAIAIVAILFIFGLIQLISSKVVKRDIRVQNCIKELGLEECGRIYSLNSKYQYY